MNQNTPINNTEFIDELAIPVYRLSSKWNNLKIQVTIALLVYTAVTWQNFREKLNFIIKLNRLSWTDADLTLTSQQMLMVDK